MSLELNEVRKIVGMVKSGDYPPPSKQQTIVIMDKLLEVTEAYEEAKRERDHYERLNSEQGAMLNKVIAERDHAMDKWQQSITERVELHDLRQKIAEAEPVAWLPSAEWTPCVKLPVTVHVRKQREGETHVSTREGITPIKPDDLIMRGVSGEEYPIGREIFEKTYRIGEHPAPSVPADVVKDAARYQWLRSPTSETLHMGNLAGAYLDEAIDYEMWNEK